MRLLYVDENGELSLADDRSNDAIPPYAILSHTWGQDDEEVTFADLTKGPRRTKMGYRKLRFCAGQAARDGLQYFWVDTCCIDKSNSTELSEALNSMFNWYRKAARCYVYLLDVSAGSSSIEDEGWIPAFRKSRWFTRGWTLQELIAPASVEFFSQEEKRLGDKHSLEHTIHEITGINFQALRGGPLSQFSTEERMLWAKNRETKREEDAAYSLLGIFDVSLPLLYGEGRKRAFLRLRKEIIGNAFVLENPVLDAYVDSNYTSVPIPEGIMNQPSNGSGSEQPSRDDQAGRLHSSEPEGASSNLEPSFSNEDSSDTFAKGEYQAALSRKRMSLARRRRSWTSWPIESNQLFENLQRWMSVPQSSIFVVKSDPDLDTIQRATDFAASVTEFLKSKRTLKVIWAFSFPIRPYRDTVPISDTIEGLLYQANRYVSSQHRSQSISSSSQTGRTEELYRCLLETLSKISECFVVMEINDKEWAGRMIPELQNLVDAPGSLIKVMIVPYGIALREVSSLTQNENRVSGQIHSALRRKTSSKRLHKWEDLHPSFSA